MKMTSQKLQRIVREELAAAEQTRELVKLVLSKLPKRSTFTKFIDVDGQDQYWFDLTWPYGDYAQRQAPKRGVRHYDDERLYDGFFSALLRKLRAVLPSDMSAVARDMSIVIVK